MAHRMSARNHQGIKLMPRVTVILTTYNRLNYLKKAIDSVLNQTFKDFELIILDNASPDETDEYVKSLLDERIIYIRNPENIGAMNNGLKAFDLIRNNIKSEFVSLFHDDDIMKPTLLEKEIYIFEQNESIVLVGSNVELINENGLQLEKKLMNIKNDILFGRYEYIDTFLSKNIFLPCSTVMIKRAFIVDNKISIKPEIGPAVDTFLWFEINILDRKLYLIHDPLLKYRIHNNQDSQINFLKRIELFYKGTINFLIVNKLKYLIPLLKRHLTKVIVLSLSKQLCRNNISKSQYIKAIEYYIDENILEERINVKSKAIMCVAKFSPEVLRAIFYLQNVL